MITNVISIVIHPTTISHHHHYQHHRTSPSSTTKKWEQQPRLVVMISDSVISCFLRLTPQRNKSLLAMAPPSDYVRGTPLSVHAGWSKILVLFAAFYLALPALLTPVLR